jgi:para-nitrobenzyl esterase
MKLFRVLLIAIQFVPLAVCAQAVQVKTVNGMLEGTTEASGIRSFKGVPFAKPPVGDLRWREPQPAGNWTGVRKADHFGPQAMQKRIFSDMVFRSAGISEDCLYLNVWTPSKTLKEKLPVLVYFYGGGYVGGDGSEPRYDGESMAKKGIVAITVNYRLGIFGFFSHPELTQGNYGLLDQNAALRWVQQNIAAFGGDPKRVTIAGESAGSISVSAQMASPLSKDLIAGAIGESGSMIRPTLPPITLQQAEQNGQAFAQKANASSLAALRAIPAEQLLDMASQPGAFSTAANVDGYFLPKSVKDIFAAGEQAHVPLLAGWNSAEVSYQSLLGNDAPTPENYVAKVKQTYGDKADDILKLYPGTTQDEVITSATALASDRFIAYSTWKWLDLHAQTGGKPTYRYQFSKVKPPLAGQANSTPAAPQVGAPHAFEIEYAMGNLSGNPVYAWTADDRKVSETMQQYFANFLKTGSPNGAGLPMWPAINSKGPVSFMNISVQTAKETAVNDGRYRLMDQIYLK